MIPVDQIVEHDPDVGQYGDCQRACIASLLEIDINDIPNFYESGTDDGFIESLNTYLATQGLMHLNVVSLDFDEPQYQGKGDVYHMIYGDTIRGTHHAVIALNGEIVHDPHPSKEGLDRSKKDDWYYGLLLKLCN